MKLNNLFNLFHTDGYLCCLDSLALDQESTYIFCKSQIIYIGGFEGHVVFVETTSLCYDTRKVARDNMWMNGCVCVPIHLY